MGGVASEARPIIWGVLGGAVSPKKFCGNLCSFWSIFKPYHTVVVLYCIKKTVSRCAIPTHIIYSVYVIIIIILFFSFSFFFKGLRGASQVLRGAISPSSPPNDVPASSPWGPHTLTQWLHLSVSLKTAYALPDITSFNIF